MTAQPHHSDRNRIVAFLTPHKLGCFNGIPPLTRLQQHSSDIISSSRSFYLLILRYIPLFFPTTSWSSYLRSSNPSLSLFANMFSSHRWSSRMAFIAVGLTLITSVSADVLCSGFNTADSNKSTSCLNWLSLVPTDS
jgi:hypothetical protein